MGFNSGFKGLITLRTIVHSMELSIHTTETTCWCCVQPAALAVECSWNVMAHGDAREGKWRGNWRTQWVSSALHITSEHGVSSITTVDAHTSVVSSRLNWRPCRFKWTRPFRRKTKSGFCACAITFQTQSTHQAVHGLVQDSVSVAKSDYVYVQVPLFIRTVGTVRNDLFFCRSLHFNAPPHTLDTGVTRTRCLLSNQFSSALHPNFPIRITFVVLCISSLTLIRTVKIKL